LNVGIATARRIRKVSARSALVKNARFPVEGLEGLKLVFGEVFVKNAHMRAERLERKAIFLICFGRGVSLPLFGRIGPAGTLRRAPEIGRRHLVESCLDTFIF